MERVETSPTKKELEEAYRRLHNLQAEYQSYETLKGALATYIAAKASAEAMEAQLAAFPPLIEEGQQALVTLTAQVATLENEYAARQATLEADDQARRETLERDATEEQALLAEELVASRDAVATVHASLDAAKAAALREVQEAAAAQLHELQGEIDSLTNERNVLTVDVTALTAQRDQLQEALVAIVRRVGDGERV
jgi:chromosome segregation ATPase